jgi:hypothetical protein
MASWVSHTFLQLVLLSVILVGQNEVSAAADGRTEVTYNDADAVLRRTRSLLNCEPSKRVPEADGYGCRREDVL